MNGLDEKTEAACWIARARAGNAVLFYDADGDGTISEKREYVFTEWDRAATSDMEALASVFDSNGDRVEICEPGQSTNFIVANIGLLDTQDAEWIENGAMASRGEDSNTAIGLSSRGHVQ